MNLNIITGDDKKSMMRKIVSWFFILMMISGLVLIFSPDSVQAAGDHNITFETSTLNDPYSDLFMTSQAVGIVEFEVDNYEVRPEGGSKSFTWRRPDSTTPQPGWWNLTYEEGSFLTNFSMWSHVAVSQGGSQTCDIAFYSTEQEYINVNPTYGIYPKEDAIINIHFSISGNIVQYIDHNGDLQTLKAGIQAGYWNYFSFTINATDEVMYCYNTTMITGTPANITALQADMPIDRVFFYANQKLNGDFDDVTFVIDIPGDTTINVYNETSPSNAIPDWNIRIYDDDTVIQYSKNTLDNPVTVSHTEYGMGNMFFEISASGYYNRTYYADIRSGVDYYVNAFLLNINNTDAHIYTCIVVDDSDLDHIIYINDATITITRVINGSIHEVSSGFTDGSGRFYVPLIAGVTYTVNITAEGYDDLQDTYVPSSTVFEQTFRMAASSPTSTSYDDFWENISIDISMVSAGCMQDGNITITYLDSNSSTTNTEIQLWEIYGPNNTLLNTWTNGSNSFFNKNSSINTTRLHYMILFFNNTAFFMVSQPITIMIPNVDSPFCDRVEPFDLDDRITDIVGPFTIGDSVIPWTTIIGTIVPIIILVSFGPFNTGLGILGCGISMAMMQGFLDMYVTGGFQWGIVGIGAFIVILGIMYIMTKGTGGDHL